MSAPSYVFTISRVAAMLEEAESWLEDLAMPLDPDGTRGERRIVDRIDAGRC